MDCMKEYQPTITDNDSQNQEFHQSVFHELFPCLLYVQTSIKVNFMEKETFSKN